MLAPHSAGFDNPAHVKCVIEHQQYEVRKFTVTPNRNGGGPSLMNTMVVNLGKDKPYYNGHSVHRNIKSYLPLVHVPASSRSFSVPYSERPVLYRWNE